MSWPINDIKAALDQIPQNEELISLRNDIENALDQHPPTDEVVILVINPNTRSITVMGVRETP